MSLLFSPTTNQVKMNEQDSNAMILADENVSPTHLDAPPTPWEQDDPWADKEEEAAKSPWEIGQEIVKAEEEKLQKELEKISMEERETNMVEDWEEAANRGWYAVVAMRSTSYTGSKSGKTVKLDHLPRPSTLEWVDGREQALDLAKKKASLVLEMSPEVRREFIAYNVCGPYESNTEAPKNGDNPQHDRPDKRRTVYIVSTRIYKKGTKECQVTTIRPADYVKPHEPFAERFPGGKIPVHDIMAAAKKKGVADGMKTLLMSHLSDEEAARHFPGAVEEMNDMASEMGLNFSSSS